MQNCNILNATMHFLYSERESFYLYVNYLYISGHQVSADAVIIMLSFDGRVSTVHW